MKTKLYIWLIFSVNCGLLKAQEKPADSTFVRIYPKYDSVSNIHRRLLGENYRKDYALDTKVPIIHISKFAGGLTPIRGGGGNQSKSLRLLDKHGKEWVLRSIEKFPEVLLPEPLRQTFIKEVVKDVMSAQNPFSALVVPVFSDAIGAPHSHPVIGLIAEDARLGVFSKDFAGRLAMIEEHEPLGKSDNTEKMYRKLAQDYNNTVNAELLLKLKCLDVLLGDWDRHDDQWRWIPEKTSVGINYLPVARDRDQVFFRSEGTMQRIAQGSYLLPMMQGFERNIQNINWFLWEGREINSRWFRDMDKPRWDSTVSEFCNAMTDVVLEQGLQRLPEPGYTLHHNLLMAQLKQRRKEMPQLMASYYSFFNKIIDIELTDKDEIIQISDYQQKGLQVSVSSMLPDGKKGEEIHRHIFEDSLTKEIRLFLRDGSDKLTIDNKYSAIKMKIIAGKGAKSYVVDKSSRNIPIYELTTGEYLGENKNALVHHIKDDSANVAYVAKDLYRRKLFIPNLAYNKDDGLAVGAGLKLLNPGFRQKPYGNAQYFSFLYAFSTGALRVGYSGEWKQALGTADLLLNAKVYAPNNTQNFFGFGNQTDFDDSRDKVNYYRARFTLAEIAPSLKWQLGKSSFTGGLLLQYYNFDEEENVGRFISDISNLSSPDADYIDKTKLFTGLNINYQFDTRDDRINTKKGLFINFQLSAVEGLNAYSSSYLQLNPTVSYFQRLGRESRFVLANRLGGGLTMGNAPFYQSQFIGGQGNLLGYRQLRFAGKHMLYNNLEFRARLMDFMSYILPGEIGLMGLYDTGRVWVQNDNSSQWHHGIGGGVYFAPASMTICRLVTAYSKEGWYPYFSLSFRY